MRQNQMTSNGLFGLAMGVFGLAMGVFGLAMGDWFILFAGCFAAITLAFLLV
jgi:hypothetical protein